MVLAGRVRPVVQQFVVVLWRCRGRGLRADPLIIGVVRPERRVLERQLAGVQIRAEELIGRLEYGAMGKLRCCVRTWIVVIGGGVGAESAPTRRMMGRLLMELLLHGPLLDVVGKFSWRHSEMEIERNDQLIQSDDFFFDISEARNRMKD